MVTHDPPLLPQDKEGTGFVSAAEVRNIIANVEGCLEEEVDEIIAEFDPKNDGMIKYSELTEAIFMPVPVPKFR